MDLMRARHRLSKLLLRHGTRFDDGAAWTERRQRWLAGVELAWPPAQTTLLDAHGATAALTERQAGQPMVLRHGKPTPVPAHISLARVAHSTPDRHPPQPTTPGHQDQRKAGNPSRPR